MRKSSRSVVDTSLESFRKHESPANISTISRGDRSSDCCMFWMHVERHSFSTGTEGREEDSGRGRVEER